MNLKEYLLKLKEAVELERKEEIEFMLNEMKELSGMERERKGRAVLDLKGKYMGRNVEGYIVKLGRNKEIKTEISIGDEVLVSKGNPLKSDLIATVMEVGKRYIMIAFQNIPPDWVLNEKIRLDLYSNDVTFKRMLKTLDELLCLLEKGEKHIVFKILEGEDGDDSLHESKAFMKTEFFDKELNEFQKEAVKRAVSSSRLFLIHGPPGTGKTRTIAEIIHHEVRMKRKVLATAESNTAVDNILEFLLDKHKEIKVVRLGHPARISKKLLKHSMFYLIERIEEYKMASKLREKMDELIERRDSHKKPVPSLRRGLDDSKILELARKGKGARGVKPEDIRSIAEWIKLNRMIEGIKEEILNLEKSAVRRLIKESDVVLSTNSSSGVDFMDEFKFDTLIIDEASQANEPSCLIPLLKTRKLIMSGDHKQLPPTIMNSKAKSILSFTLFERLSKSIQPYMLRIQYRMNEKLVEFPNVMFYKGKLITHDSVKNITLRDIGIKESKDPIFDPSNVLVFVDTSTIPNHFESQRYGSTSYYNELEALIVERVVARFLNEGLKEKEIGVITPYDDQVELLKSMIKNEIQISSVDGFQGREKELIIISFVRSNRRGEIGFLDDERRLNVSLTRAKRKLICIGDSRTLSSDEILNKFILYVIENGCYVSKKSILDLLDKSLKIL